MKTIELAQAYSEIVGDCGELARALLRARQMLLRARMALVEINHHINVNTPLEAYLFAVIEWGIRDVESQECPRPEAYGLEARGA